MSLLDHELSTVGARFRRLAWWRASAILCILLAILGVVLLCMQVTAQWMHPYSGWLILGAGVLGFAASAIGCFGRYRDQHWIAQQIEDRYPELDQRLITSLDEIERNNGKPLGYLQHTVFQETIAHSYHNPWWNVVSADSMSAIRRRAFASILLMIAAAIGLMKWQPPVNAFVAKLDEGLEQFETLDFDIKVEPGNWEVEKGSDLIVVARFGKQVPKVATIVVSPITDSAENSSATEFRVPMSRSLDDPLFGGTISEIQQEFTYSVGYNSTKSETYRVTVFTYPELVRADALVEYPSYTDMAEKRIEDTRRVSVVEGTNLTWEMHLNKPGIVAELVPEEGDAIPLLVDATDPLNHLVKLDGLKESATWKLSLKDKDGRENRIKPTIKIKVTPNLAPKMKLELARDARVSPLEEFLVKATVSDDYGLEKFGLNYTLASASPKDVILGQDSERREKKAAEYQLDFEALEAEPDQLLSYYFWAEDTDADGQPRRTLSDMYFAEVRHFEEIFRQGEQQPGQQQQQQQQQQGQQSQNAQDAEQLGELQKQIVNATWTMIRREISGEVSEVFEGDISTIIESQQTALQQSQQLGANLQDDESKRYLMDVQKNMNDAIKQLTTAYSDRSADPLTPAMIAERLAYQSLLKLRAREHDVVQQQQQQQQGQQSQSASRQRMQQQLQQLELQNDENRYETQRQAQEEQDQEQTEMRQALSRLKELAQRQQDLNEQLKELQNALEQAKNEEEREEIERQLKRLRDQQEEMLRDTDELMERLDEAQDQETMQETREQLEQTREQMRESAESLQKGEVTPALASGTRAQRELEEMREELRRESANQFSDQMRDMRDRVRELDDRQQELGQQMEEQTEEEQEGGGLRREESPENRNKELSEGLREQNQKLNELLQEIEETVREADETEPLLAESLYEAFRQVGQDQTPERLDRAAELTERGLTEPAKQLESEARESISEFRQQIDRAAESVLGDETDALRTAVRMLEDLERQLGEEIDQFSRGEEREGDQQQPREPGEGGEQRDNADDPRDQERQRREDGQEGGQQEGERDGQNDRQEGERGDGQEPRPGEGQQEESDQQQEGQPPGQQPGQGEGQPNDQEQQQRGQGGENQGGENQEGDPRQEQPQDGQPGGQRPQRPDGPRQGGSRQDGGWGGWEQLEIAPITGEDFREWSDRLRDVEEIVEDPELRAEAARIREQARGFRREFKRHSEEPKWDLVKDLVARPLSELRQEVSEELLRRSAEKNALVPIDRDPVPEEFVEQVRRYYENLGSGR